jgi:hypothetical protein
MVRHVLVAGENARQNVLHAESACPEHVVLAVSHWSQVWKDLESLSRYVDLLTMIER